MPVQSPPRPPSALASLLAAAGIVLTVASCTGHITPLGPDQAATMPQPHHPRHRPETLATALQSLTELSSQLFARDQAFFYSALVVEEFI